MFTSRQYKTQAQCLKRIALGSMDSSIELAVELAKVSSRIFYSDNPIEFDRMRWLKSIFGEITTIKWWDCRCPTNYIHSKYTESCLVCGTSRDLQPDSMIAEVIYHGQG